VGDGEQLIPWEPPKGDAPEWVAGFRPSDVQIAQHGTGLRGTVKRANFLGATMDYLIEVDGAHLRTSIETHEAISKGLMFKEGETCVISFRDLLWFNAESLKEVVKQ
jgi:iron(III) transport system ATP-binding protein